MELGDLIKGVVNTTIDGMVFDHHRFCWSRWTKLRVMTPPR